MNGLTNALTTPKRPEWRSLLAVILHVAFVLLPIYTTAIMGLRLSTFAMWLWFGLGMNGLINLMHEASHYHVFGPRWASDLLGRWVLGPLALADFDSYRARHWQHHRRLGEPDDPKVSYHVSIRGWGCLFLFFRSLFLVEALKKLFLQMGNIAARADDTDVLPAGDTSFRWLFRTFLLQIAFLGSVFALAYSVNLVIHFTLVVNQAILGLAPLAAKIGAIERGLSKASGGVH